MLKSEVIVLGVIGLIALLALLGLANAAKRFEIGPQWLRRFVIEKHTYF